MTFNTWSVVSELLWYRKTEIAIVVLLLMFFALLPFALSQQHSQPADQPQFRCKDEALAWVILRNSGEAWWADSVIPELRLRGGICLDNRPDPSVP